MKAKPQLASSIGTKIVCAAIILCCAADARAAVFHMGLDPNKTANYLWFLTRNDPWYRVAVDLALTSRRGGLIYLPHEIGPLGSSVYMAIDRRGRQIQFQGLTARLDVFDFIARTYGRFDVKNGIHHLALHPPYMVGENVPDIAMFVKLATQSRLRRWGRIPHLGFGWMRPPQYLRREGRLKVFLGSREDFQVLKATPPFRGDETLDMRPGTMDRREFEVFASDGRTLGQENMHRLRLFFDGMHWEIFENPRGRPHMYWDIPLKLDQGLPGRPTRSFWRRRIDADRIPFEGY